MNAVPGKGDERKDGWVIYRKGEWGIEKPFLTFDCAGGRHDDCRRKKHCDCGCHTYAEINRQRDEAAKAALGTAFAWAVSELFRRKK